jgi:prepilin-type N-terminal cleavage/methylation domain-containing protein
MAKGFTVIELLIVLALIGIIASLGMSVSLDKYRLSLFQDDTRLVLDLLIQARAEAMENQNSINHGLRIEANKVTRLPENDNIQTSSTLNNTSGVEIIFSALSGSPLAPISFTLTNGTTNKTVSINPEGVIED